MPDPVEARRSCTACNTTLKQIIETGRVGCSTCYATFPAQLESLLEGIHVALAHRGKVPRLDDARARVRADLQSKRGLLKTALNIENYEEAAALRDEIRALEMGLSAAERGRD
jgi:protein arginine kinase activator